jgi:hypothetical protein
MREMTEKKGFQASLFKGNHQKILPNFQLGLIIAQPIQNPGRYLSWEETSQPNLTVPLCGYRTMLRKR